MLVTIFSITIPVQVFAAETPYNGPHNMPGNIQAEDFNNGGQYVAYYANTSGNAGGIYRTDVDVDIYNVDAPYVKSSVWCTPWNVRKPNQEWIKKLVKNLNSWRKGIGIPFLCLGRMQKPYEILGVYEIPMILYDGRKLHVPSLLTSRWMSPDGRDAQVVCNYTPYKQTFSLRHDNKYKSALVHLDSKGINRKEVNLRNKKVSFSIRALSAIIIEFLS